MTTTETTTMTTTCPPLRAACLANDLVLVQSLIASPFNIDEFLNDMIKARPQEWGSNRERGAPAAKPRAEDAALKLILTECGEHMSPEALNTAFKNACFTCAILIPIFLELYADRLAQDAVSEGIIICACKYQQLCLAITERCIDRIDAAAFAQSFAACCSLQKYDLLEKLIGQYEGVPDLYQNLMIMIGLSWCCDRKDTNIARLILTKCGNEMGPDSWPFKRNILEYFFIRSVEKNCSEITELILTEFGHRLKPCVLISGFGAACWASNLLAIDLFIKTYGSLDHDTDLLDHDTDLLDHDADGESMCVDTPSFDAVETSTQTLIFSQGDENMTRCAYTFSQANARGHVRDTEQLLRGCGGQERRGSLPTEERMIPRVCNHTRWGHLKFTDSHTFEVKLKLSKDGIVELEYRTDYPMPCPCIEALCPPCLPCIEEEESTPCLPCALKNIEPLH